MSCPIDTADSDSCYKILLLGKTGSGKSSTGNTILGYRGFDVGPSFSSVTKESQSQTASVDGRWIKIIDTPGLFDPDRPLAESAAAISHTLTLSSPGPHVVLYVIRLDTRFTEEQMCDYKAVLSFFGEDVKKHIIVVFLGWEKVDDEWLQLELKHTHEGLQTIIDDCENRYVTFDNRAKNKEFQVDKLLQEIQKVTAANRGKHFSMEAVNEADPQAMKDRLDKTLNELDDY